MKEIFDIFGEEFKFNYNGKYEFKTSFGAYTTLFYLGTLIAYFLWNLIAMFQHAGLNVNSYDTLVGKNELYSLNSSDTFLSFSINRFFANESNLNESNTNFTFQYYDYFNFASQIFINNTEVEKLASPIHLCTKNLNNDYKYIELIPDSEKFFFCYNFSSLTKIGGNFFSDQKFYFTIQINFDFTRFKSDFPLINLDKFFPLNINFFSAILSVNPNNYKNLSVPFLALQTIHVTPNITSLISTSLKLNQIFTDSSIFSFIASNSTENIFSSDLSFMAEYIDNRKYFPDNLLQLNYYLNPIKKVYFRKYMKLQDVLNNVNSISALLMLIASMLVKNYNKYKIKVDFIQDNILFRMGKLKNNDITLIPKNQNLNNPEVFKINPKNDSDLLNNENIVPKIESKQIIDNFHDEPNKNLIKKIKSSRLPVQKIKMKSFFNDLNFCQSEETKRDLMYSDDSMNFFETLIDVKRILLLLGQFEDLKQIFLPLYQNALLEKTKIIMNDHQKNKKKKEDKLPNYFEKLKRKITTKKYSKADKIIFNKF
jgi:hypothetical protein